MSSVGFILNFFTRRAHQVRIVKNVRRFHISNWDLAVKGKSVAQKKSDEVFNAQKQLILDYIKKGNLDCVDALKANVIEKGNSFRTGQIVSDVSFDGHFIAMCSDAGAFSLARNYFLRLYNSGKAGTAAIGKFFILCHDHKAQCSAEDRQLMLELYDRLLEKYGVLDTSTCGAVAQGLALTDRWRSEIPRLFKMIEQGGAQPSSSNWATAVEAAWLHGDEKSAWEFMDAAAMSGRHLIPKIVQVVLEHPLTFKPLLRWLEKHGVILDKHCADVLVEMAPTQNATANYTTILRSGSCRNCRLNLRPTPLLEDEFDRLREAFLASVLVGKNVLCKTSDEEINSFLRFLDKSLPVDVVLDGLNIAYLSNRLSSKSSRLVKYVTSHFVLQSKKVLVIGRKHMENWPAHDMNYIRSNAKVFFAENLSQDDPFLLYAALKSGIGTRFVSRDRMGSHKFLLPDVQLRRIFSKWQALHQYHPLHVSEADGRVFLRAPLKSVREAQALRPDLWHVPVVDHSQTNVEGHLQDERAPWLCVKFEN
ncbi:Mitochondrial ribonuclease p protein [Nesidiocoris tenuis]|uniref:Mitochondrial ribonuclease P catalytic subunit n=1 Tax=Nesidiocoris tenuis TaxID=355587 RepID=A0ABN7BBX8_9HEMI|nr:Mitochondrial ribonuclease p protein [Nesidiocoris tenuis]